MNKLLLLLLLLTCTNTTWSQSLTGELIEDFYQGKVVVSDSFQSCDKDKKAGNCAAIAIIKASLAEFKTVENIFKQYKSRGDSTFVTFQDNKSIIITRDEIKLVEKLAGIKRNENSLYYKSAVILYTIMCKKLQVFKPTVRGECINSFTNAVEYLNNGYSSKNVYKLLGFTSKNIVHIPVDQLFKVPSAIIWSKSHAAYLTYGKQDFLGKPFAINNNMMITSKGFLPISEGAYFLKKGI